MKKAMSNFTIASFVALLSLCGIYMATNHVVIKALSITAGTVFYHFAMRLVVGLGINAILHNRVNYKKWWFRPRRWEKNFYKFLHVKSWKKHIPTYDPDTFNIERHTLEEIVQATCQSEIVHETIMILSFVPIVFAIWFDEIFVFFITSVLACSFDSVFVILQRYNRPRLVKLLK